MGDYISRNQVTESINKVSDAIGFETPAQAIEYAVQIICKTPAADVRPVVTCQTCIHAEPFERHCVLNSTTYMHCKQGRGSEVENVWHKYKKYYRDYSVVDRDGYCDEWADMRGGSQ